ncbi:hypothetical protein PPACK8108_LOCUS24242 [Phakopsora pachyrhizi]|uniref:Zn(2)-C6 fungal-type domain-containing protein n=1 Tax=Phakopsora pachyrhizi TaxID=170000 RepID=A0AAV0BSM9_PHAPC|nr:hypothetical protein PPACK8108_LOCUS24242 [Phakopsora pachyrhizi]
MDGTNGFTAVKQFTTPCEFCKRNQLVCCASTTGKSAKCEACRVSKVKCSFSEPTETRGPWSGVIPPLRLTDMSILLPGLPLWIWIQQFPQKVIVIVRAPRTSGGLAGISQGGSHESDSSARANLMKNQAALDLGQKEVIEAQEDLRNEVEPATQKRK